MNSTNFFETLPLFENRAHLIAREVFYALPEDWHIVVSDIKHSTKSLEKGNYKGVNFIAASVLMAVLNIAKNNQLPFMFGGDGSSICIPQEYLNLSQKALVTIKKMAKEEFDLELRVGIIPYSFVLQSGHKILIAKYKVSENYNQAFFKGNGMNFAERYLKQNNSANHFDLPDHSDDIEADLSGIECRWDSVPSPHGETLALLIKVNADTSSERDSLYMEIVNKIHEIYGDKDIHHPLSLEELNLSYNINKLKYEAKAKTYTSGLFKRISFLIKIIFENFLGDYFMKTNSKAANVNWGNYKKDLIENSHFFGFNDMINMVCSGNEKQRNLLVQYLDFLHKDNKVIYGLHVANSALITCLIFEREKNHIHFVDADLGGYAKACKQLKKQALDLGLNL